MLFRSHSLMYGTPLDAPCRKAHHSHLNRINPTTYAREMASNSSGLTSRVISGLLNFDGACRHCSPQSRLGSFDGLAHVSRAPTTAQDAHLHRWVPMAMAVASNSSGLTSRQPKNALCGPGCMRKGKGLQKHVEMAQIRAKTRNFTDLRISGGQRRSGGRVTR